MRALIVALSFMTRLPMPRIDMAAADFAGAMRLYPVAGLVIGALVAGAGWLGALIDPWLGALAALATWIWITGALHLDGLGDMADGLGAAHGNRDRLLAVMADPHIGSVGVIAITLQLSAKLVLLHLVLPDAWPGLLAIPAAARIGPLLWARLLRPLRPGGLGATIAASARRRDAAGWGLLLLPLCLFLPWLLATFVILPLLGAWFARRVGGVTGDIHGAGIELTESALLIALILAQSVGSFHA